MGDNHWVNYSTTDSEDDAISSWDGDRTMSSWDGMSQSSFGSVASYRSEHIQYIPSPIKSVVPLRATSTPTYKSQVEVSSQMNSYFRQLEIKYDLNIFTILTLQILSQR
jgi:hypothetical protein